MARRRHSRRRSKEVPELDITTFLNLMVVLVPFLLISAVFSRVTILELSVPTEASAAAVANKPNFSIEIIVRGDGLEFANGTRVVAKLPKEEGSYNLQKLSDLLVRVKEKYPQKEDATVLMEPNIEYDYLIQVMDTVRGRDVRDEGSDEVQQALLFPNISIGDAP
ncbi:MAG: biopolymer transporter ExbD [Desulfuromonas sp.]|nr:MAG: biopolymer transporter ExbD [Desulfuromonas sp.]